MIQVDPYLYRLRESLKKDSIRRQWEIATRQREEKELAEQKLKDEQELAEFIEAVFATPDQIEAFSVKLDHYDEATVKALMQNQRLLDVAAKKIETMFQEAHILPDGRRVFKTRDGLEVFDEHGTQLPPDEIHAESIDNHKPRWEDFQDQVRAQQNLKDERREILEFQQKLDDTRERLDDPKLTDKDLADLEKDLENTMPLAVRQQTNQSAAPGYTAPNAAQPEAISLAPERRRTASPLSPAFD